MKQLLWLLLSAVAFGQVPTGLSVSVDYRNPPELPVIFSWLNVPGATYNVYEARNAGLTDATCPVAPTVPDSVDLTTTNYVDNPNPGWWALPMTDGRWKGRVWCYWVTSVVNGVESAKAGPKSVTVGNAGYVFLSWLGPGTFSTLDPCLAGPAMQPPSMNLADYGIELYYQEAGSTVKHDFQTFNLFEKTTSGFYMLGVIWHTPSVAKDGFIIPLSDTGTYGAIITVKPNGKRYGIPIEAFWMPRTPTRQGNYYTQVNLIQLIDPADPTKDGRQCTLNYFGQYDLWENIITD